MTKVYILTAGEYSDFHIVATFSTRELAEEAKKFAGDNYPEIHEYEVDSVKIPEHPPGHTPWHVNIDHTGAKPPQVLPADVLEETFTPSTKFLPEPFNYYTVRCWARDEEHATKIALDKYYQWKYEYSQGVHSTI